MAANEQNHLLTGKNTRKLEPGAALNSLTQTSSLRKKTIWFVLLVVAVAGVIGYALTMTPLEAIQKDTKDTKVTKERRDPHPIESTEAIEATDAPPSTTTKQTKPATKGTCAQLNTQKRDPTVLIYNRVPKAGSSSMTSLISKLSSKNDFRLLGWFDLPSHDFEAVQAAVHDALAKGEKTVIAQHFHFPEIIHEDVAYINVLREPVSRCTSQYYYLRYGDRRKEDRKKVLDKFGDQTIDECINSGKYDVCFNCDGWKQSLFFCGPDGGECGDMSPNEVLSRAKQVISAHYVVGVIEDFEGTVAVMEKLFPSFFEGGLELLKKVKPQRVTQGSSSYVPPSNSSIAVIKTILDQDEQLYGWVKGNLDWYKQCVL